MRRIQKLSDKHTGTSDMDAINSPRTEKIWEREREIERGR